MAVQYISGDLFINRYKAQALAHGCNCQGVMGAGVAVEFRKRYPAMYEEYHRRCKAKPRLFNPGEVMFWKSETSPHVFNLATQEDTLMRRATYPALEKALTLMQQIADQEAITSIAMPRIGAGLGRLDWNKVHPILTNSFENWSGILYVYEAYKQGE